MPYNPSTSDPIVPHGYVVQKNDDWDDDGIPDHEEDAERIAVVVETKSTWADDWEEERTLVCTRAVRHLASVGGDRADFHREFGPIKEPWETDFAYRAPWDTTGWWVRVLLVDGEEVTPIFVGRFDNQVERVGGANEGTTTPSGVQRWVAKGAGRTLETINFDTTQWLSADNTQIELARMDGFNRRNERGWIVGNRTPHKPGSGASHLFGGRARWSRLQMLEYLLAQHVAQWDGPTWEITGRTDLLQQVDYEVVPMRAAENVAQLMARIVPTEIGVDWYVEDVYDGDGAITGFAVRIVALPAAEAQFDLEGEVYDFAADEYLGYYDAAHSNLVTATLDVDKSQQFDRVILTGQPIQFVTSIGYGTSVALAAGWDSALQATYIDSAGDTLEEKDAYRAQDEFADVFQRFVVDRATEITTPVVNLDGSIDTAPDDAPQDLERSTAPRLPLRYGGDYTTDPPSDVDELADVRPPFVIAYDEDLDKFVPADALCDVGKISASVMSLPDNWGFRLRSSPNHGFARGTFSGAGDSRVERAEQMVAWEKLTATIAIVCDGKLRVGLQRPTGQQSGENRTKVLRYPQYALHAVAPNAVIGIDTDGTVLQAPGALMYIRDDRAQLAHRAVGAAARFLYERARLTIVEEWLQPWHVMLGAIFGEVDAGDVSAHVNGPLTSVEYDLAHQRVTLRAGQGVG